MKPRFRFPGAKGAVLVLAGLLLLLAGLFLGEGAEVRAKGSFLCLECIGLG
ncbi:MAG TPA: thioredoxin [bacterium]|nr:thioredoxin [bacterium]HPJ72704.1 thioredoxin [bacterium]HPQ67212.1 thioredoxin [bacterium]